MKINADDIWSEKQGRGFLPGCDIETGTGEKETR